MGLIPGLSLVTVHDPQLCITDLDLQPARVYAIHAVPEGQEGAVADCKATGFESGFVTSFTGT